MRHHLPILAAVLVLIPLMGGVQQCGGAPPHCCTPPINGIRTSTAARIGR